MNDLFWLTLILFVVAIVLRSELFFYLLYLLVGLQLVARLWVGRSARHLSWQRRSPTAIFPGEEAKVELEVRNGGLLPLPWLSLHESLPPALHSPPAVREVLSLAAGEQRVVGYTLRGARRGFYQLGPLTLRTGDVLGLREQSVQSDERAALTIYPTVLPLAALGLPAALPFGVLPNPYSLFVDPARPAGVRPYQQGDDPRRIDWKSSARAGFGQGPQSNGTLLVRRSQPAIALETLVALAFGLNEYGRFAYDDMERALTAAASIAAHLAGLRQPVGLCASGRDPLTGTENPVLPVASGRAHLLEVLGVLGRLESLAQGDLPGLVTQAGGHLGWGSTVVVLAGGGPELIEALLPLRRRGFNLALVIPGALPNTLGLARRHGMAAYTLTREGRPTANAEG